MIPIRKNCAHSNHQLLTLARGRLPNMYSDALESTHSPASERSVASALQAAGPSAVRACAEAVAALHSLSGDAPR